MNLAEIEKIFIRNGKTPPNNHFIDFKPHRFFCAFQMISGAIEPTMCTRSMPIPGGYRTATKAHSNLPRSGGGVEYSGLGTHGGLPKGWTFIAQKISAKITEPFLDEVVEVMSLTSMQFTYNGAMRFEDNMMSLLHDAAPLEEIMEENRFFRIILQYQGTNFEKFEDYLRKRNRLMFTVGVPEGEPRPLMGWIYLDGLLDKPVT